MRGLGDKPVRTNLTHTTLPRDCVAALNKLGRFDEMSKTGQPPTGGSAAFDEPAVFRQTARRDAGDRSPQLGHRLRRRGDGVSLVGRRGLDQQGHHIGALRPVDDEPGAAYRRMAADDLADLLRVDEHATNLGGLIGAAEPALDALIGASTGAWLRVK